jgi:DNA repair protein RadA/Sms
VYNIPVIRLRSTYVCQNCGYESSGWLGKCPNCGEWNSLVETAVEVGKATQSKGKSQVSNLKIKSLSEIKTTTKSTRTSTNIPELDRVLGGGLVGGQVVLIAGEPGIGKSTILLQVVDELGGIYVSGEESASQIKIRADRLGIKNKKIEVLETNDVDAIVETINQLSVNSNQSSAVIVDSIQTMQTSVLSGMAGSVGQVRECTYRLVNLAKSKNIPLFIVGHATKEGSVAGPMVLAHLVDTVLWFEGDKSLNYRILRAHKNRFGPTDEVGIFKMEENGLVSVKNPNEVFVSDEDKPVPGSAIASPLEGTRPILAEIQSLVVPSKLAIPRRVVQGIDSRRAEIMIAILAKRAGLQINFNDVFVNVVGGISIRDTSCDFALLMSLASAYLDKPLPKNFLALGEVDLIGRVRQVNMAEKRIKEARRLGYKNIITFKETPYISQAIRKYLK